MIPSPAVPDSFESDMILRRLRLTTLVPCVGVGVLLLSAKLTGLLSAILLVGILIVLHELGHFLAARRMGVPVDVFSVGFGQRLCGFQWKETDVRLSLIPLGGYVRLAGEESEVGTGATEDHPLFKKPYHQRMFFYSGGIIANVLTTLVLMVPLQIQQGRTVARTVSPVAVGEVVAGMPAAAAGLQVGDKLLAVGEVRFPGALWNDAVAHIQSRGGQPLTLEVDRNGQRLSLTLVPVGKPGSGRIGVAPGETALQAETRPLQAMDLVQGVGSAFKATGAMAYKVAGDYFRLFTGQLSVKEIGGPVSIVRIGSQAAQAGWYSFLFFAAYISINLAVLNALPIPGLDGSHALILTLERIRRKDFSIAVKERILATGFYLMLGLLVVVWIGEIKGQNAGWRGNQKGASRHLNGGVGAWN